MDIPLMVHLNGKNILIVGGGSIGLRKAKRMIQTGALVTCVSKSFADGWDELDGVHRIIDCYDAHYLEEQDLVIAATNSPDLNTQIYWDCKKSKCLCMTVDQKSPSDFSFMATQRKADLLIAVSTYGKAPVFSKELASQLIESIDESQMAMLQAMITKRKNKLKQDTTRRY